MVILHGSGTVLLYFSTFWIIFTCSNAFRPCPFTRKAANASWYSNWAIQPSTTWLPDSTHEPNFQINNSYCLYWSSIVLLMQPSKVPWQHPYSSPPSESTCTQPSSPWQNPLLTHLGGSWLGWMIKPCFRTLVTKTIYSFKISFTVLAKISA